MADDQQQEIIRVFRQHLAIYPEGSRSIRMLRKALLDDATATNQPFFVGTQPHPINFEMAIDLMPHNAHHETCIRTKVAAVVGLGFLNDFDKEQRKLRKDPMADPSGLQNLDEHAPSKAEEVLNPLCDTTLQDLLDDMDEDRENTGNGYIEVVRESPSSSSRIVSLWHIPAPQVFVEVETASKRHFRIIGTGKEKLFARFGDLDDFLLRPTAGGRLTEEERNKVSEVIHFRKPTSRSRYYGFPQWLSVVPAIELIQMLNQQQFDFFLNRGVPEFMLFFIGSQLKKDTWKIVEDAMRATIGQGNQHKSLALNITDTNMKIQLEKLAVEGKTENSFKELSEASSMEIITGHRVPPLLAGMHIPGKLGAVNEFPNAMMSFQSLFCDQEQRRIEQMLASTLGDSALNGGLGLTAQDMILRKTTDRIDMPSVDTVSRMRQPAPQAQQEGRNMQDGVKKDEPDILPEEIGRSLGRLLLAAQRAVA